MDWFKFYGKDFLVDPKRKRLGVVHQLMWVMLLCYASDTEDGVVRYVGEYELAMDCMLTPVEDEYEQIKGFYETLSKLNMVEVIDENTVRVINYIKRQSTHLTEAERAKRYRENKKKSDARHEGQSDERHARVDKSRVDKKRIEREGAPSPESSIKILDDPTTIAELKSKFPGVDVEEQLEQAKDWLVSKGKNYKDYVAFARNWLRKPYARGRYEDRFNKSIKPIV